MALMKSEQIHLENLREEVKRLLCAAESLPVLFQHEAVYLRRNDQATDLIIFRSAILDRVEREISSEGSGESGDSMKKAVLSLVGLAGNLLAHRSGNARLSGISQRLLDIGQASTPPFGSVVVGIAPGGLPDDVRVICISRLARDSRQEEAAITDELGRHGFLLLSPEAFSQLIDKLVDELRSGNASLPVGVETLVRIHAPAPGRLIVKKIGRLAPRDVK